MSLSTRHRCSGAIRLAVVLTLVCAVQWLTVTGAAAAQLVVVAAIPPSADREATLAVDVHGATPEAFSVSMGGARLQSRAVPVFQDRLSLGLVIDASESGSRTLQAGLGGAANLLLEVPTGIRTAVVADTSPPTVVAGLRQGATEALPGLTRVRASGERRTPEALNLVLRQLAPVTTDPRVVVLYTTAADAGGPPAADLVKRFQDQRAILAVVTTANDASYWQTVVRATGGVFVAAHAVTTIEAFSEVADVLRARHLVTFTAPQRLPAPVSLDVTTADGTLTAEVVVPAAARTNGGTTQILIVIGVLGTVALMSGSLVLARRRKTREPVTRRLIPVSPTVAPQRAPPADPPRPAAEVRVIETRLVAPPPPPPKPASPESGEQAPDQEQDHYSEQLGAAVHAAERRARAVGAAARTAATQSGAMPLIDPSGAQPQATADGQAPPAPQQRTPSES
jgi:hypothetical protein